MITQQQLNDFERDGYVVVPGFYSQAEITQLQQTVFNDESLYERAWNRKDATGTVSKVCLWQKVGDDFYSMFSRGRRIVDSCEYILGEPVYHSSTKIMMKEPFVGGAWEWHQDFGYWHAPNFILYPKLISCMIAINQATVENGCLQVLKGSHHIGRLDHVATGDQKGANMDMVEEAIK